jgi:hypothetical protein
VRFGQRRRLRLLLPFLAAAAALLTLAPLAAASFHLIKVREVYPGAANTSYVELQSYASGQNFLSGHALKLYDSAGTLVHTSTFAANAANAQSQVTVLIGDGGVEASFGVKPDLVDSGLEVPASGGAACWNAGGIPADCVAWGNFSGAAALQSATGTTVGSSVSPAGVTAGKAIRRSIAPGCSTLLEDSDDTNISATDFAEVAPAPRSNSSAIVETTCAGVPNTVIDEKPEPRTNSDGAQFTYESPTATGYECRLDAEAFAVCPAGGPTEYAGLLDGSHTFQVRGVNGSGPDPTPASYTWIVDTVEPTAVIDTHPTDPSRGDSVAFAFHADESSSFECSLVALGTPPSYAPCQKAGEQTYTTVADGEYTFSVRPTDLATNVGTAATFEWEVSHLAPDTTPPQTTIVAKPTDPSTSSSAAFAYESTEPGSTFECSLDGAAFASCPAGGAAYSGLANGSHSFQVRAVDADHNTDPSPAGYTFTVAVEVAPTSNPPAGSSPATAAPPAPATAPQTILGGKPAARTRDRTPTFRFRSDAPGAGFECALDRGPFKPCRSPFTTKKLSFGPHTLSVRAVAGGAPDRTPARFAFRVVKGR